MKNSLLKIWIVLLIVLISLMCSTALGETEKNVVSGKVYNFEKNDNYEFSKSKSFSPSDKENTYGNFYVTGDIVDVVTKNSVPAYEINSGNLSLFYTYSDSKLKENKKSWYVVEDKSKKIDGMKINKKIDKGTIILQTSKDRKNWIDVKCLTNAFRDEPVRTKHIYETKDVELLNGCYYRLIVVYKMKKFNESKKVLFVKSDDYDYKKVVELYEFYAYSQYSSNNEISKQTYNIGEKIRTEKFAGYSGEQSITKNDSHYGWELGHFFVSGYTDKVKNADGNMVFLKNVGDKVALWFKMEQNINSLNGNKKLTITSDTEGYDEYFETPKMNLGKGVLIIRHTDYNGNKSKPQIYTNYLESNTVMGTDTKVQLFEEGDYEVALDYQITNNKLIDSVSHYRIFFEFSVRNGNCMVYPFDILNGNELTNSSMTDNGFKLDLAKSRYLKVNVKREVLADSADGLVEDTRFNGPAKDGDKYDNEGIYTITVENKYTSQSTTKKIYVGTNNILKAHIKNGLTIAEINNLVDKGALISDDGTLQIDKIVENSYLTDKPNKEKKKTRIILPVGLVLIFLIFGVALIKIKKRKLKKEILFQNRIEGGDQ